MATKTKLAGIRGGDWAANHGQPIGVRIVASSRTRRLWCLFAGHRWAERKPHRMWDINDFDCARCGKHKREGLITRG